MNSQKGVTAISMVIVVIIIILLAGFSIFSSRDLVVETNLSKVYNEIAIVINAAKEVSLNHSYRNTILDTLRVTDISNYQIGSHESHVSDNLEQNIEYYYLGFHDASVSEGIKQAMNDFLGIRGIEHNYLIGMIDEGVVEVYLIDGVRVEDTYYYSYQEIANIYQTVNQK